MLSMGMAAWLLFFPAQRTGTPVPQPKSIQAPEPLPPLSQQAPLLPADPMAAAHDMEVGIFYYHRGNYVGALARFQDAMAKDPPLAEPRYWAGNCQQKLGQVSAARTLWKTYLKLAPGGEYASDSEKNLKKYNQ